jgi:hypothetical protein
MWISIVAFFHSISEILKCLGIVIHPHFTIKLGHVQFDAFNSDLQSFFVTLSFLSNIISIIIASKSKLFSQSIRNRVKEMPCKFHGRAAFTVNGCKLNIVSTMSRFWCKIIHSFFIH